MALSVDIRKDFGAFRLEVQFDAQAEPLALLGASGCGKSVTLRCIAGTLTPDEGRIVLDGRTLFDSAGGVNLPPQKRQMGYLFQQYALFPNMTVRQNIAAAAGNRQSRQAVTEEQLSRFRLTDVAALRPHQLSGGQQQRTALARILASQPKVLLLDEPFSALDSYLQHQLEVELAETLDAFSGPVVWVSHDRGEVFRNCRRVCVLDRGRSQPATTLEDLFHRPGTEAAARLSGCKNFAHALPQGDAVALPAWGLTLPCGRQVPPEICRVGIRAHHVRPDAGGFPCAVVRVVEDVFSTIVLLRPATALPEAPLLRMELSPAEWQATGAPAALTVSVSPEDILLLQPA